MPTDPPGDPATDPSRLLVDLIGDGVRRYQRYAREATDRLISGDEISSVAAWTMGQSSDAWIGAVERMLPTLAQQSGVATDERHLGDIRVARATTSFTSKEHKDGLIHAVDPVHWPAWAVVPFEVEETRPRELLVNGWRTWFTERLAVMPTWHIEQHLIGVMRYLATGAVLSYRLDPDRPNEASEINQGYVSIQESASGCEYRTLKVFAFRGLGGNVDQLSAFHVAHLLAWNLPKLAERRPGTPELAGPVHMISRQAGSTTMPSRAEHLDTGSTIDLVWPALEDLPVGTYVAGDGTGPDGAVFHVDGTTP